MFHIVCFIHFYQFYHLYNYFGKIQVDKDEPCFQFWKQGNLHQKIKELINLNVSQDMTLMSIWINRNNKWK